MRERERSLTGCFVKPANGMAVENCVTYRQGDLFSPHFVILWFCLLVLLSVSLSINWISDVFPYSWKVDHGPMKIVGLFLPTHNWRAIGPPIII